MAQQKVCMFVWNHFTNDARVLRECTALVENGYEVDLVCIHDWKQEKLLMQEQHQGGFTVTRVKNRVTLLQKVFGLARRVKRIAFKNIITTSIFSLFMLLGIWKIPLITIGLILLMLVLSQRKVATLFVRGAIFIRMIQAGLRYRYDIYHSNDLNTLPQGFICAKILRRKKLIYDSHEVQTSRTGYNSSIYGIMEKFFIRFCDVMIVENHTRAKHNEDLYGFYPKVIHNYPFLSHPEHSKTIDLHEILNISRDEPIFLYQGGIQIGRGLDKLIQAVPLFKKGVVVFIGDGRIKSELQQMVQQMNLENRVKFLPKVPVQELIYYTKNAYLGFQLLNNICFNHYSASSNKLFEYMMSGVPVIACSFPEIQGIVEKENTGVCVDSHDPTSIANGVNYLLDYPEKREEMRVNAFNARYVYNWELEKKLLIQIYKEILDKSVK
ncbi:glycosyl transferase [Bacillus anthracis]|uniref:glycosyltransferase n=1 Tax=Bacillus TaxID=1386 RepID=UPI0010A5D419|nr:MULTISPECIES: glycosyltransferase [Bacillus]QBJ65750.1 glycosyl transferase [Bacillus anthracis]THG58241.1 glycosyltransferase family 4 protein [Bacillus sp. HUB-I-004]